MIEFHDWNPILDFISSNIRSFVSQNAVLDIEDEVVNSSVEHNKEDELSLSASVKRIDESSRREMEEQQEICSSDSASASLPSTQRKRKV